MNYSKKFSYFVGNAYGSVTGDYMLKVHCYIDISIYEYINRMNNN